MQYRRPGRTVTTELSAGHSRIGCAGSFGSEVSSGEKVPQPPLALIMQGRGARGVSNGRPLVVKPTAKPPATSKTDSTDFVLAPPCRVYRQGKIYADRGVNSGSRQQGQHAILRRRGAS